MTTCVNTTENIYLSGILLSRPKHKILINNHPSADIFIPTFVQRKKLLWHNAQLPILPWAMRQMYSESEQTRNATEIPRLWIVSTWISQYWVDTWLVITFAKGANPHIQRKYSEEVNDGVVPFITMQKEIEATCIPVHSMQRKQWHSDTMNHTTQKRGAPFLGTWPIVRVQVAFFGQSHLALVLQWQEHQIFPPRDTRHMSPLV